MKQKEKPKTYNNPKTCKYARLRAGFIVNGIIALAVISVIAYMISVNDISIKGFVLNDLKLEQSRLGEEHRQLELAVMKLEAYDSVNERARGLSMVDVGKIDYVSVSDEAVAKR